MWLAQLYKRSVTEQHVLTMSGQNQIVTTTVMSLSCRGGHKVVRATSSMRKGTFNHLDETSGVHDICMGQSPVCVALQCALSVLSGRARGPVGITSRWAFPGAERAPWASESGALSLLMHKVYVTLNEWNLGIGKGRHLFVISDRWFYTAESNNSGTDWTNSFLELGTDASNADPVIVEASIAPPALTTSLKSHRLKTLDNVRRENNAVSGNPLTWINWGRNPVHGLSFIFLCLSENACVFVFHLPVISPWVEIGEELILSASATVRLWGEALSHWLKQCVPTHGREALLFIKTTLPIKCHFLNSVIIPKILDTILNRAFPWNRFWKPSQFTQ